MTRRALGFTIVAAILVPRIAVGDADEASVEAHAIGGIAFMADAAAEDSASAPLVGIAVRASYATHDWFQYELGITAATTTAASYDEGQFTPDGAPAVSGAFDVAASQFVRAELGVMVRLGVRIVPCLRLFVAPQVRRTGEATVAEVPAREADLGFDLVGGAGIGLDYRVGRRLVVGVVGSATYAVPIGGGDLHTLELGLKISYYWYP